MVFVISKDGEILMPTKGYRKVRQWLSKEQAKVISSAHFTIQLLFDTTSETQSITSKIISRTQKTVLERENLLEGWIFLLLHLVMHRLKPWGSLLKRKIRYDNSAPRLKTDGFSCQKAYKIVFCNEK